MYLYTVYEISTWVAHGILRTNVCGDAYLSQTLIQPEANYFFTGSEFKEKQHRLPPRNLAISLEISFSHINLSL